MTKAPWPFVEAIVVIVVFAGAAAAPKDGTSPHNMTVARRPDAIRRRTGGEITPLLWQG